MTSAVKICSDALVLLGESPINDFDVDAEEGGQDRARICSNLWPFIRDFVISRHDWKSCRKRVALSPTVETPAFGYENQFTLPSDWVRNVEINGQLADQVDHVVESQHILMDGNTCRLIYVWENTDPASWDTNLQSLAVFAAAAMLAYPITESTTVKKQHDDQFINALTIAKAIDSQNGSTQVLGDFDILSHRRSMP